MQPEKYKIMGYTEGTGWKEWAEQFGASILDSIKNKRLIMGLCSCSNARQTGHLGLEERADLKITKL